MKMFTFHKIMVSGSGIVRNLIIGSEKLNDIFVISIRSKNRKN